VIADLSRAADTGRNMEACFMARFVGENATAKR